MLRTERLEQYNGTAFWNKENKQIKGIKYNERSKWIICQNAHPAIITDEELKKAIDRKKETQDIRYKPKSNSNYLLSGKNLEGEFLFVCANCGGHVIGHSNGHSTQSYTCGINRHKGSLACDTNWKTSKNWLEEKIIEKIQNDYTTPQKIDMKIKNLQKEINSLNNNTMFEIDMKKRELCSIEKAIDNLLNSIKNGVNPELIVNEINKCKEDKDVLLKEIKFLEMNCKNKYNYSSEEIKKFFNNINKSFEVANMSEKKELLKTFIRKIVLNQKKHQISVEFYPDIFMVPIGGAIFLQVTNSLVLFLNYDFIIYEFLINFNGSMEKNV